MSMRVDVPIKREVYRKHIKEGQQLKNNFYEILVGLALLWGQFWLQYKVLHKILYCLFSYFKNMVEVLFHDCKKK